VKKKDSSDQSDLSFEDALSELENLVEKMEAGELSLEESLKSFEKGIALTRSCQKALSEAEQKVEILTSNDKESKIESSKSES
tara:strand:- start:175 stop:423 length:249 start_codon:yes stop_codon:yes gene_type:complete